MQVPAPNSKVQSFYEEQCEEYKQTILSYEKPLPSEAYASDLNILFVGPKSSGKSTLIS